MTKYEFTDCRPTYSVSPGYELLRSDCPSSDPSLNPSGKRFRELVGVLRWLEQCTRPDISAALSELGKVQLNPAPKHVAALEHLVRYVYTTRHLGLFYGSPPTNHPSGVILGYVDANWEGRETRIEAEEGTSSAATKRQSHGPLT